MYIKGMLLQLVNGLKEIKKATLIFLSYNLRVKMLDNNTISHIRRLFIIVNAFKRIIKVLVATLFLTLPMHVKAKNTMLIKYIEDNLIFKNLYKAYTKGFNIHKELTETQKSIFNKLRLIETKWLSYSYKTYFKKILHTYDIYSKINYNSDERFIKLLTPAYYSYKQNILLNISPITNYVITKRVISKSFNTCYNLCSTSLVEVNSDNVLLKKITNYDINLF